jgi:hypothetical protein
MGRASRRKWQGPARVSRRTAFLEAAVVRPQGDPLEVLRESVTRRRALDQAQAAAVASALARGDSWRLIGDALGVSRQAARQRYLRSTW